MGSAMVNRYTAVSTAEIISAATLTVPMASPVSAAAVSRFHLLTKPARGGMPTMATLEIRNTAQV